MALVVKNPPASAGRPKRHGLHPWVWKIPWRRAWQPTPVFLPGEFHGQGCTESDMTEATQHTRITDTLAPTWGCFLDMIRRTERTLGERKKNHFLELELYEVQCPGVKCTVGCFANGNTMSPMAQLRQKTLSVSQKVLSCPSTQSLLMTRGNYHFHFHPHRLVFSILELHVDGFFIVQ